MAGKNKISKDVLGICALLLVFIFVGLFLSDPNQLSSRVVGGELTRDPSINNNRRSGSRGFYLTTRRLGYKTDIWRTNWRALPQNVSMLISIAPDASQNFDFFNATDGDQDTDKGKLTATEATGLLAWLSSGHTMLLLTSRLPVNLMYRASGTGGEGEDTDADKPTFGDVLGLTAQTASNNNGQRFFGPLQPSPLVAGVASIALSTGNDARLSRLRRDGMILFGDIHDRKKSGIPISQPVVMEFAVGKGRVIAVADDYFASNGNLTQADNAVFLSNVLTTCVPAGGRIVFDEYHHGEIAGGGSVWDALGLPLQSALVQLTLACLVLLVVLVPRFGTARRRAGDVPRTSAEYVASLAGLYQRAHATIPALESLYRQFLRDLCARFGLPPDVSLEQLADVAARRGSVDKNALRLLLSSCERHLERQVLSETELLSLARRMEEFKRQL